MVIFLSLHLKSTDVLISVSSFGLVIKSSHSFHQTTASSADKTLRNTKDHEDELFSFLLLAFRSHKNWENEIIDWSIYSKWSDEGIRKGHLNSSLQNRIIEDRQSLNEYVLQAVYV